MVKLARKPKPPEKAENAPTRVSVSASASSKRVAKAGSGKRISKSGGSKRELSDNFSDALQRPESAAGTKRGGNRVAVELPSASSEAVGLDDSRKKSSEVVKREDEGEEDAEGEDDEDGDSSGFYGVFVQTRRCEKVCRDLGLSTGDIRKMKRKYDANDMYNTGEITQAEFFYIINEERRPLTIGILNFARVSRDVRYLSFDQYLLCVVSFAALTKPELYQYVFDLYDADKSGSLDEREFAKMSKELQSPQFSFPKNVETAIRMLGGQDGGTRYRGRSDDGIVDFDQFMKFARNFPVAFYPILNMQKNVRAATLGESYWSRIVARKLKVQETVSYMRRHNGAIPQLTFKEKLASIFSSEIYRIQRRAGQLYGLEMTERRRLGWNTGEDN